MAGLAQAMGTRLSEGQEIAEAKSQARVQKVQAQLADKNWALRLEATSA